MTPARLILLGKPDCHLCHQMAEVVAPVAAQHGFTLEQHDVRSRPEWKRYLLDIPVLLLDDGRELARHRTTADVLGSLLAGTRGAG